MADSTFSPFTYASVTTTTVAGTPTPIIKTLDPIIATFIREATPLKVIVIGAGGIGARVIPAITKLLRAEDTIHVVDGDVVEERNVFRQHFGPEDVGMYKAEVMQSRYHTERIPVTAHCMMLSTSTGGLDASGTLGLPVILGCVDTRDARRTIKTWIAGMFDRYIYIDAGNDRRSGQVLVGFRNIACTFKSQNTRLTLPIDEVMPQIFTGVDDEEADGQACGVRVDPQTMNVNNMAAAVMINALAMFSMGLPMTTCGWLFSTFNSMTAIPITSMDTYSGYSHLHGSTQFARREGDK